MNKTLKLALVAGAVLFTVPSYGMLSKLKNFQLLKKFKPKKRISKVNTRNTQNFFRLIYENYTKIQKSYIKQKRAEFDAKNELIQLFAKVKIDKDCGDYPYSAKAYNDALNYRKKLIKCNRIRYKDNPILISSSGKFKGTRLRAFVDSVNTWKKIK